MARPRFLFYPVLLSVLFLCSFTLVLAQTVVVRNEVKHDVSAPLREMVKGVSIAETAQEEAEPARMLPLPPGFKPADAPDMALQRTTPLTPAALSPALINNFDGIGQGVFDFTINSAPPDTNGAVGLTQYVQWVNTSFAVFDKATGNILPNFPVAGNALWKAFGGPCETNNDGDPIVVYDKLNDRWILGQLAVRSGNGFLANTLECVAVSTTPDATGAYNRYAFQYNNEFDDYPKMSAWPDAYYATFNMFDSTGSTFIGAEACAFDGNAMRNGQAATQVCFPPNPNVLGLLPADVDGHVQPPAGSPNFMLSFGVNSLNLFKFHVDFANPANSTLSPPTSIPVTAFTPLLCNGTFQCVSQPNTSQLLDSLGDRLMYRLAYRNFGDHESLVVNHSVAVGASSGVRWYEIQNPNGTPVVAQQSTFAPDGNFRWMGSIAMDVSGDLALGYSISSNNIFPSIAVAGQASADARNTLQPETPVISGTGSQEIISRWGDYSAMQVDPSDDCTFWYTQEYLKSSGDFNWNTRIANFKFPGCGVPDLTISSVHSGNFTQGQTGVIYTITVTNVGVKPTDGSTVTVTDTLPVGLSATAISGIGWNCALGTLTCTRTDVLDSNTPYPSITLTANVAGNAAGSVTNTAIVSGGGEQNTNNDTATDLTTVIQTGADPAITKTHTGHFIMGQTATYTITVTNVGLTQTDGTAITVTDTLPAGLTFNAASGTGWACVQGPPVSCTRSDVLASNASYPAITLTVNVAANAPALVVNTATVSGGGDVNPLNNTANDPTGVNPPPADLTIAKSHFGNFNQGQTAPYTITVSNIGAGPTVGVVTVADTLPSGFAVASMSGTGWFCNTATATCTRNDILPANSSYPPITLSVNVADNAPASVTNTAMVSGGGEVNTGNDTASDPTTINPAPDVTIALSHTGDPFTVGQSGTYTITVSNIGTVATVGTVNVTNLLPQGLAATNINGAGWDCAGVIEVICARGDSLAPNNSYPPITVTASVTGGGPSVTNTVTVNGGGEFNTSNDSASDVINVTAPVLAITKSHAGVFSVGQSGSYIIQVSNTGAVATLGTVTINDFLP